MSKLFSKPKALLSVLLVLCMVVMMLPAGIFTLIANASNSDSISVWDGKTIEPFENYYQRDEDGEYILDEDGNKIPRLGTDFYGNKESLEIANANQLAFFLLSLEGTKGDADSTNRQRPITFTFNEKSYTYTLPYGGVGWYGNTTVVLTADIDMNNIEIKNTNSIDAYFTGLFDGQGHTVYNINRVSTVTGAGFFRRVGYRGVKNLTVTGTVSGTQQVGGIAGAGASAPVFENCAFIGTITASEGTVGGIVGRHNVYDNAPTMRLKNCYTVGSLTVPSTSNDAGGLVGYSAYSAVSTANKVPGGNVEITNCYSAMNITCNSTNSGGLVARAAQIGTIEYTDADGNPASADMGLFINNCHYSGTINKTSPIASAAETVTNTFYKKGSHTGTASGAIGAVEYEASEIDEVVTSLNAGVDALEAAGTTGLNRWMAGPDYPIFVQEEPALETLTVDGALVDLQKWPTYFNQTTEEDSATVAATVADGKLAISAVDGEGNAIEIGSDGAVALKEGQTTVITIKVTYKELTKTYTVNIYKKPVTWNGTEVATAFADGTGTSADPYRIANAAQLRYFAENLVDSYSTAYIKLVADIDMGNNAVDSMGDASTAFKATFDGDNHTIYNYNCQESTKANAGIFCYVNGGTIKNLHFVNATVADTGSATQVGGIAGKIYAGRIENCSFDGAITTNHCNFLGGIAGMLQGSPTIVDCWTTGSITASGYAPGGVVGAHYGSGTVTITSCWSAMKLWGGSGTDSSSKNAAGIIPTGGTNSTLNITDCYFVGTNNMPYPITKSVTDDTYTVNVVNTYHKKGSYTGTLAGTYGTEKTDADFASTEETGVAALLNTGKTTPVWSVWNGLPVLHNGYEFSLSGIEGFTSSTKEYTVTSKGTATFGVTDVSDETTVVVSADNASALSFANGLYTVTTGVGETVVVTVLAEANGHAATYTVTVQDYRWNGQAAEGFADGSGTQADPYEIAHASQLKLLADNVNAKTGRDLYYELTADIDLSGYQWTPIGNSSSYYFAGTFDGNNHTITGLTFDTSSTTPNTSTANAGLFGVISGATINDLAVEGVVKSNTGTVGGIAGTCSGASQITNCHFAGTVQGAGYNWSGSIGGLVGNVTKDLSISESSFTGEVLGKYSSLDVTTDDENNVKNTYTAKYAPENVGGLVGCVGGGAGVTIEDSYVDATVSGGDGTGGLVGTVQGHNNDTTVTIESSYSAGTVDSIKTNANQGGLVGWVRDSAIDNDSTLALTMTDCYSTVKFTASYSSTTKVGGLFAGARPYSVKEDLDGDGVTETTVYDSDVSDVVVTITDCYFAGTNAYRPVVASVTFTTEGPMMLTWGEGTGNIYYLTGSYTNSTVVFPGSLTAADCERNATQFADGTVSDALGDGWATSTKGYPVRSDIVIPENALVSVGTAIRTQGTTGMRFYLKANAQLQNVEGLKEYGGLLIKGVNNTEGLFIGKDKTKRAIAFNETTDKHVRENITDGDVTYNYFTALLNITTDANLEEVYNARAYALFEDDKGQEIVVYSTLISQFQIGEGEDAVIKPCTLYNLADAVLADYDAGTVDLYPNEVEYLESIVAKKKLS